MCFMLEFVYTQVHNIIILFRRYYKEGGGGGAGVTAIQYVGTIDKIAVARSWYPSE